MGCLILINKWKFLNTKGVRNLIKRLQTQYGFSEKLNYAFIKNDNNKVYIINKDIDRIPFEKLRLNSIGMYFCEDKGDSNIRLSIEGSQIIGPMAVSNVIMVDDIQKHLWLKGFNIEFKGNSKGYIIIKSGDDFLGSAKHKNGRLLNHVPKERRIKSAD